MPQTPTGTANPYCTSVRMFDYHDWQQVADFMRVGDNPRPSYLRLLDATSREGERFLRLGLAAAGEIESACLVGKRYLVEDLQALTNSGLARLEKLNADLWFYACMESRQPGSADTERIPGYSKALKSLEMLESGERIFSFTESADAGLPSISQPDVSKQANPLVANASPLFGTHRTGVCYPRNRRPY